MGCQGDMLAQLAEKLDLITAKALDITPCRQEEAKAAALVEERHRHERPEPGPREVLQQGEAGELLQQPRLSELTLGHFLLKCCSTALEFRVEPGILVGDSQLCRQGRRQALVLLVEGLHAELIGQRQITIHAYRRGNGNAEKGVGGRVARWKPQ